MSKSVRAYFAIAALALFVLFNSGIFAASQLASLDIFRHSVPAHPDIVLLAIDNNSIGTIGRWPWDHKVFAELINKTAQYKPRAMAFDVDFFETQNQESDKALQQSIDSQSFPIVLSSEAVYYQGSGAVQKFLMPLYIFLKSGHAHAAFTNVSASADGEAVIAPAPLSSGSVGQMPLSWELADNLGAKLPDVNKKYLVNFGGASGTIPTYSVSDVINGKVGEQQLRDKIILVGATASDLHDIVAAPVPNRYLAGVEWHGNVLSNILLQNQIQLLPAWVSWILGLVVLILFLFLLFFKSTRVVIRYFIGTLIILFLLSFGLWQLGYALPYFSTLAALALLFIAQSLYRWFQTDKEKRRIKNSLQFYFSPQILNIVLERPEQLRLGGQRTDVTILFSDIRSFTTLSEQLEPEVLSGMLHEYFTEMSEEILARDGVIDKFIGDAVMAFWGAPLPQEDQADRAVSAALGMLGRLHRLNEKWQKESLPVLDIGVGINSGSAIVGNMGSEKRFDYTVVGDSVNVASRLEGLNKQFGSNIIISESTKFKLSTKLQSTLDLTDLGEALLKGKTKGIKVYSVKLLG